MSEYRWTHRAITGETYRVEAEVTGLRHPDYDAVEVTLNVTDAHTNEDVTEELDPEVYDDLENAALDRYFDDIPD